MLSYSILTILPMAVVFLTAAIFAYLGWAALTHH